MKQGVILSVTALFFLIPSIVPADELEIAVKQGYAPISGYFQTPAGGKPGTSDMERPTFGELDTDDVTYTDIDLQYKKGKYIPYIGMRFMGVDSSGILEKDLITRGLSFPEGQSYDHETSFNIYRLGAKCHSKYLNPKAELALMDFSHKLETPTASCEREYMKASIRVGCEKVFKFNKLDLELEASGSIPLSNTPHIYTGGAELKYWFTKHFNVGTGVQYFYLDYQDNQELPNHLRVEMCPAFSISLQYRF